MAVPPTNNIERTAVVDLKTKLRLPFMMVQTDSKMDNIDPMFSFP